MWTTTQTRAFERGLAVAKEEQPAIDRLREIAAVSPMFAERVASLATMHDYLNQLASVALAMRQ